MAKYTVSILKATPSHNAGETIIAFPPEAVLVVEANNEDAAKRKAYDWLLSGHRFFAEAGAAKKEDFVEDVPFHDLTSDNHTI